MFLLYLGPFSPSASLYELLPTLYLLGILNTVSSKPLIPLAMHKYKVSLDFPNSY